MLSDDDEARQVDINLDAGAVINGKKIKMVRVTEWNGRSLNNSGKWKIKLDPYCLKTIAITYS